MYQLYADRAAFETHRSSPAAERLQDLLDELLVDEPGPQVAFNCMKEAAARFRELGVDDVEGPVADPDPLKAIVNAVGTEGPFDEIIISTPPKSVSKWVSMDPGRWIWVSPTSRPPANTRPRRS